MSGLGWRAGVVVAALLLSGCSGEEPSADHPPPSSPPTSPVTTTSPTPTPEPPVLPAAARENTKAGAVAFADFYIDLVNYAMETGDVGVLRAVSDKSCASCQNFIAILSDVYSDGGSVEGGAWSVDSYSAIAAGQPATWLVAMDLTAQPQVVRESDDSVGDKRAGGRFSASMYAKQTGRSWTVQRLVRDE